MLKRSGRGRRVAKQIFVAITQLNIHLVELSQKIVIFSTIHHCVSVMGLMQTFC